MALGKEEQIQMHQYIMKLAQKCQNNDWGKEDSVMLENYSLTNVRGRLFYNSLSDAQLLAILKDQASVLGHTPTQAEVFWVWRDYIRARFHKWPYALKAAGLSRSAGRGGKSMEQQLTEKAELEKLLMAVREKAYMLGRIPHPKDLPAVCNRVRKYWKTWGDVISAAEIDPGRLQEQATHQIENLEYKKEFVEIRALAETLGRAPMPVEIEAETRKKLIAYCGSWRNTLYQIGLEPVRRINPFAATNLRGSGPVNVKHRAVLYDCYYKVMNLSDGEKEDLEEIRRLALRLGRTPEKKEVPPAVRERLQSTCGSWQNTLYQIGLENKNKDGNGK